MSNVQVYNIKRLVDSPSLTWSNDIDGQVRGTVTPTLPLTFVAISHEWLRSYDATTGLFTATRPLVIDLGDTPVANTVLAGPTSGAAATATFRALVSTDIPNILTGTGIARNTEVCTELSGDATTSGSNVVSVIKVNGGSLPTSATIVGTNGSKQVVDASSATLSNNTSGTASNLSGTPALPNGTTATTQPTGDSTTKLATDAFVTTAINNAIAAVNPAIAVQAATTAASDTSSFSYANGVSGIGATLTGPNATAFTVDGFTFTTLGQRVLVKNDTQTPSGAFNGVYYVTTLQGALQGVVLTRALDYDQSSDINNTGAIPVVNGTVNGTTSWLLTSLVTTVGTDPLTYVKFSSNPTTLGTVTSFSAGTLAPLFTTSVATSTTTPALSFALSNAAANTVLAGPTSGAAAAPTFRGLTLASADFANQGTTSTVLHGNAAGNPSFGAVVLTTDVSGTLPPANGGVGVSSVASQDYFLAPVDTATMLTSSVAIQPIGTLNHVRAFQFNLNRKITFTRVSVFISTANNGSKEYIGIYSADKTTLLAEAIFTSTASTGVLTVTIGSVTLNPGTYWLARGADSTSTALQGATTNTGNALTLYNGGAIIRSGDSNQTISSGHLPTGLGTITASGANLTPIVLFEP